MQTPIQPIYVPPQGPAMTHDQWRTVNLPERPPVVRVSLAEIPPAWLCKAVMK